ncbi:MAG: diphosphomevalonate decarboxylase [Chitinophagaceae bacterium]|nr:MAG: diphosphomevalonate decarboxylase [Chitinophagaceae bacterium]
MTQIIKARYPSNIALVKYWGKRDNQLPCNTSLSMTLNDSFSEVSLQYSEKHSSLTEFGYYFEGIPKENFRARVLEYVIKQKEFSSLLKNYALRIDSKNNFPHSAGIASSASAFAAIAAVLLKASAISSDTDFTRDASRLARLGSGSACRSFYGPYASWGHLREINNSSDDYAIPVKEIHENFRSMRDAVLIVEDSPKKIPSSVGHAMMKHHPFAAARFQQADKHCIEMLSALKNGDMEAFISITEGEALSLHAMMMTSGDYYLLFKPETVYIMEQIFQFRKDTGLPVCFTLDAGPNVHLLYPESIEEKIIQFLKNNFCDQLKSVIYDHAGQGGSII